METFESIGEIAATLAGFSAILVAIQFDRVKAELVSVRDFLLTALSAILFAFIPKLLVGFLDEHILWQIACGGFGAYHAFLFGMLTYQHLKRKTFNRVEWLFVFASFMVITLKLLVGAGYLLSHGLEIYLLGLVWLLFNSIFMFYGLYFRVIWGDEDKP